MVEEQNVDLSGDEGAAKKAGKGSLMKMLLFGVIGLVVLGGGVGGTLYMTGMFDADPVVAAAEPDEPGKGEAADAEVEVEAKTNAAAIYLKLDPPFTVSLDNDIKSRYLQLQLAVMARDEAVIEAVRRHRWAIRNNLNFLFAVQKHEDIATKQGKESLQQQATQEIRDLLKKEGEASKVEALYFTDFVID